MPIVESLMASLEKRYGKRRAHDVYYSMVGEAKGPFAPGGKYHAEHEQWAERNGVPPIEGKKKPASPAKGKAGSRKRR